MSASLPYINALQQAVGVACVLTEPQTCALYAADRSSTPERIPSVVVKPTNTQALALILKIAHDFEVSVVARGSGTGTTGGAAAIPKCMVISFEKMNRLLEIDCANQVLVTEPGVITSDLQRAVEQYGLYYPPDPSSASQCTIGGNVAENAGGPRALKYGVTGNYVIGLEGFFANGTPFKLGGKQYKNVAGYDLKSLLVGSEGTLGVISKIYLRLIPLPKCQIDIHAIFEDYHQAVAILQKIYALRIQPCLAELMDKFCIYAVEKYLKKRMPDAQAAAHVIFQVDGNHVQSVYQDAEAIQGICLKHGATKVRIATTDQQKATIWAMRHNISNALKYVALEKISHDIVVPPSRMADYLTVLQTTNAKYKATVLGYGHLGDGNLHVNILKTNSKDTAWAETKEEISQKIIKLAVDMGGTITGEHGIGLTKKRYLNWVFSLQEIALLKGIKKVWDPKGILNPGKIL